MLPADDPPLGADSSPEGDAFILSLLAQLSRLREPMMRDRLRRLVRAMAAEHIIGMTLVQDSRQLALAATALIEVAARADSARERRAILADLLDSLDRLADHEPLPAGEQPPDQESNTPSPTRKR